LIVTVAVWRALLYTRGRTDREQPSGLRSGLWLGLGLTVGELVSGLGPFGQWVPEHWELSLVLVPAAAAYTAWIALCGRLQLRIGGRPLLVILPSALAAVLLAMVGLSWWTHGGTFYVAGEDQWRTDQLAHAIAFDSLTTWVGHDKQLAALAASDLFFLELGYRKAAVCMAFVLWAFPLMLWMRQSKGRRGKGLAATLVAGLAGGAVTIAGMLGLMAYLHSWRQPLALRDSGFDVAFSLGSQVVVWIGILLTSLTVAALVRREQLLRAVSAAVVAQSVAVLAGFAITTTWGCLGPLRVSAAPCTWQPDVAWTWSASLARSTIPSVYGAALAATLVIGVVRATGTRKRPGTIPAPPRPSSRLHAAATMTGVTVLTLTALLISERAFSAPRAPQEGATRAAPAPVPPKQSTDPHVRARQALAWLRKTKGTHLKVLSDYVKYGKERKAMLSAARRPSPPVPAEATRFRIVCTTLATDSRQAQGGLTYPDPVVQRDWSSALRRTELASATCLDWLSPGGKLNSGAQAIAALDSGVNETTRALQPIMARLKDAKQYWPDEFKK
jgi:hypothetical protein